MDDMDDPESGGTVGRKKGKKTKRNALKKQAGVASKDQLIEHNEHQEADEESAQNLNSTIYELQRVAADGEHDKEISHSLGSENLTHDTELHNGPEITESQSESNQNTDTIRISQLEEELAQSRTENAQLDDKYKGLLGRVASIRTTLTDRLNKDAEELQETKRMVETLEERSKLIDLEKDSLESSLKQTLAEKKILSQEVQDLRQRFSVSQQNWLKEREEFELIKTKLVDDLENARKSAQDWEVLAMEESSVRRALEERSNDIEEQCVSQREALDKEALQRSQQAAKISDLHKALHDIQQTRKEELRNIVESTQLQIESLTSEKNALREELMSKETRVTHLSKEVERMSHFESEVKEKTLLIGKLRHQGVILNEHLTKALRMIKRGDSQDNVDRQLVTNLFLSFLGLPRGDAKRFEVLQLIANYLKWTDEDRETAGLSRPGTSGNTGSLPSRTMQSPITQSHLVNSTQDINNSGENLAELWASFLQQQTENRESTF
ncbi:hypothetical protein TWF694_001584 [Orbilia ellipsospora]|uniref:GRIP domain-containing protein n=1 Tax=Orbilia ellipsospora TaxID=2528407 RepID=A0AAV9X5N0_9PEZI